MSLAKTLSPKTVLAALALAGAGTALVAPAAAIAGTVVASSGPSAGKYPVGKKLADTARITLKAGDKVTVLTSKGTRVISGAGTHVVGARGGSRASTFAALTRSNSRARARTGAVRSGKPASSAPRASLWSVSVAQAGTVCLPQSGGRVNLVRPAGEGQATYNIASSGSAAHTHVTFEDGETMKALDTTIMPISAGMDYTISGPNGGSPVTVNFTMLDEVSRNPEDLASALIANGCTGQLELLSNAMMTS